jgi:hypothetical protein
MLNFILSALRRLRRQESLLNCDGVPRGLAAEILPQYVLTRIPCSAKTASAVKYESEQQPVLT